MKPNNLSEFYKDKSPLINRLSSKEYILFVEELTAVFDGFKALDIPAWGIKKGELRVLIGPNGAGKTTLCDLISGKTKPTTGYIYFEGKDITNELESDIALKGIGRKFQTPKVYDSLTTYDNMELALPGRRSIFNYIKDTVTSNDKEKIKSILEKVNLIEHHDKEARHLSHGQRQWLSISMLILSKPKLLLIDEPAAGLSDLETQLTAELLIELRNDHTIMVIEHDMDFVRKLDSKVTVLNEGKLLAEDNITSLTNDSRVIEAYLGR